MIAELVGILALSGAEFTANPTYNRGLQVRARARSISRCYHPSAARKLQNNKQSNSSNFDELIFFGGEGAGESAASVSVVGVCWREAFRATQLPFTTALLLLILGCCCCCSCCCCCCCCLMLVSHAKACPHFFSFSIFWFYELHKVSPSYCF